MNHTYCKRYTIDKSKKDRFILLDTYQGTDTIFQAMKCGKRVLGAFIDNFEEYLFEDGFLRVSNELVDNNDFEIHSTTEEGLEKLTKILGLSEESVLKV